MGEALTKLGINLPSLIAQGVNFGILFGVLWFFLYKPVLKALRSREEKIAESVENAEKIEKELAQCELTKEKLNDKATIDANKVVEEAKQNAKEINADAEAKAKVKTAELLADAELDATRLKSQIVDGAKGDIASLVEESLMSLFKKDSGKHDDVLITEALFEAESK